MKVYFPKYYADFSCISHRCRHSCCVGWEITLDPDTEERYLSLSEDISRHIRDGVIALSEYGKCPFLRGDGLCRIIAEHGEEMLSDICHHHPRFYHRIGDRIEGGIGLSCEEAARLILSCDSYEEMILRDRECQWSYDTDFDTVSHRNAIYSILSDRKIPLTERLEKIKEIYDISELSFTDEGWNRVLSELEYLHPENEGRLAVGKHDTDEKNQPIFERFLAYLLFRHLSIADSYQSLRARLEFCLLLLSVLENFTAQGEYAFEEIADFARMISEEIEYSEDNTASLIFEFEANLI